ncbi:cobalamin biosynthesis protein [Chachezhania sediminis]|uniref:cobalamin biosynthesis protein n=1 Tax=Chachezhania sediminis TaxID=2599291 RepID=UPI00131D2B74|nr:cobalamin biosynthesis protein [Chachezhania sediminis]
MIVAGFGFRAAATADCLRDALKAAGGGEHVSVLAAPEDKCDHPAIIALAHDLGVPLVHIPPRDLRSAPVETRSAVAFLFRGTGSVAEAAALSAAGPGARLLGPRAISEDRMATCALAEGDEA